MSKTTITSFAVTALIAGGFGSATVFAQEDEKVNSPSAVHEQTSRHLAEVLKVLGQLGTPETAYDYISPALSGPVVVLQGFTINGALKDNAQAQVQKLSWVTHVVNEVEIEPLGPEVKRVRQQIRGTLQKQVPQAFPENHANIRIKVTLKGDVTLVGVVEPGDKERFAAALEQIKHITFVGSVKNDTVVSTH